GGHRQVDLADQLARQPARRVGPGLAAVAALVKAALARTADDGPRFPLDARSPGVYHAGIAGHEFEVHCARAVRDIERLLPRLSAVRRLEDSALAVGLEDVSVGRHPDGVGIAGMNPHRADLSRAIQAGKFPAPAAV